MLNTSLSKADFVTKVSLDTTDSKMSSKLLIDDAVTSVSNIKFDHTESFIPHISEVQGLRVTTYTRPNNDRFFEDNSHDNFRYHSRSTQSHKQQKLAYKNYIDNTRNIIATVAIDKVPIVFNYISKSQLRYSGQTPDYTRRNIHVTYNTVEKGKLKRKYGPTGATDRRSKPVNTKVALQLPHQDSNPLPTFQQKCTLKSDRNWRTKAEIRQMSLDNPLEEWTPAEPEDEDRFWSIPTTNYDYDFSDVWDDEEETTSLNPNAPEFVPFHDFLVEQSAPIELDTIEEQADENVIALCRVDPQQRSIFCTRFNNVTEFGDIYIDESLTNPKADMFQYHYREARIPGRFNRFTNNICKTHKIRDIDCSDCQHPASIHNVFDENTNTMVKAFQINIPAETFQYNNYLARFHLKENRYTIVTKSKPKEPEDEETLLSKMGSFAMNAYGMLKSFVINTCEQLVAYVTTKLSKSFFTALIQPLTEAYNYFKDNMFQILTSILPLVMDLFTDLREVNILTISSYLLRFANLSKFWTQLYDLIKSIFSYRDEESSSPNNENPGDIEVGDYIKQQRLRYGIEEFVEESGESPIDQVIKWFSGIIPLSKDTLMKLSMFNQLSTAMKNFKNLFFWVVDLLPLCIQSYIKDDKFTRWNEDLANPKGLYNLYIETSQIMLTAKLCRKVLPKKMVDMWHKAYLTLNQLMDDCGERVTKECRSTVRTYYNELRNVEPLSDIREMEPLWIMIYGESRIGKSKCLQSLAANMLDVPYAQAMERVYTRNTENDYWDGYNASQHEICLFDDLGAVNDEISGQRDLTGMIQLISDAPYRLNMSTVDDASVGKKGTFFNSNVIISYSNTVDFQVTALTCEAAYKNRRHWIINVQRRTEMNEPVPLDLVNFTHLKFLLVGAGAGPVPYCNCGEHERAKTFNSPLLHPNHNCRRSKCDVVCATCLNPTRGNFNFNEVCRFLKLQYNIKKLKSKLYRKGATATNSYSTWESDFDTKKFYAAAEATIISKLPAVSKDLFLDAIADTFQDKDEFVEENADQLFDKAVPLCIAAAYITEAMIGIFASYNIHLGMLQNVARNIRQHPYQTLLAVSLGLVSLYQVFGSLVYEPLRKATAYIKEFWNQPEKLKELQFEEESGGNKERKQKQQARVVRMYHQSADLRIDSNAVSITVNIPEGKTFRQNAFFTHGYYMLTTAHSFRMYDEETKRSNKIAPYYNFTITYQRNGEMKHIVCSIPSSSMIFHPTKDLVNINCMVADMDPFRDRRRMFAKDTIALPDRFDTSMLTYDSSNQVNVYNGSSIILTNTLLSAVSGNEYRNLIMLRSSYHTKEGDCGGLVSYRNTFIGVHVGQSTDKATGCYAIPICMDDIVKVGFSLTEKPILEFEEQADPHAWSFSNEKIVNNGKLAKKEIVFSPTKTQIRPSRLNGIVFPCHTAPAILHPSDPRNTENLSPLYLGIQKYDGENIVLPAPCLDRVEEALKQAITIDTGVKPTIYTEDQVLNGDPLIPFFSGIELDSSCGNGYPTTPLGKRAHITPVDGRYTVTSALLREKIDNLIYELDNDIFTPTIVIDSLKDERRSHAKIDAVKTRIFNVYPMENTILMSMYFGSFVNHIMQSSKSLKSFAVGINPYSTQWHDIFSKLIMHSVFCFDGDGETFDATFPLRSLLLTICKAIIWWTLKGVPVADRPKVEKRMWNLFLRGINVAHKAGSFSFSTFMGILSGWFLTTIVNCLVILSHIFLSYISVAPVHLANYVEFDARVKLLIFGDDHIVSIRRDTLDWFNFQTTFNYFKDIGLRYTSGAKVAVETRQYWSIKEVTFLKNSLGKLGHFYVAQLDMKVVTEMINWIRKCEDPERAMMDNIKTAQRYLFFYGRPKFDEIRELLLPHVYGPIFTYDELAAIHAEFGDWEPDYVNPMHGKIPNCIRDQIELQSEEILEYASDSLQDIYNLTFKIERQISIIENLIMQVLTRETQAICRSLDEAYVNIRAAQAILRSMQAKLGIDNE